MAKNILPLKISLLKKDVKFFKQCLKVSCKTLQILMNQCIQKVKGLSIKCKHWV